MKNLSQSDKIFFMNITKTFNEGGPLFRRYREESWIAVEERPPFHEIPESELKDRITTLSEQNNIQGLRNLAYDLFNTPGCGLLGGTRNGDVLGRRAPSVFSLAYNLSPFRIADIAKITTLMIQGVDEYRKNFKPWVFYTEESQTMKSQTELGVYAYSKCNPEDYVRISHGGGERSINDFLKGKSPGYPLDSGDLGIQVHPLQPESPKEHQLASWYANRSIKFFDRPAILTGKIQYKYLTPAPNFPYEAGIKPEHIKHLEDQNVRVLD